MYEEKKLEALEEFQEFALSSVFKRCVDVTLDKVFNEENLLDYEEFLSKLYERRRSWLDEYDIPLLKYSYLPHFTSDDFLIANFEKHLESRFHSHLKKKKMEEEKKLKEYATLHLSRKCLKLCENNAFNHFFGKFKNMFPAIERGPEDEHWGDTKLLHEKRHEKDDVKDYVAWYLRSDQAKNLEEKLKIKILKQVAYLKENIQSYLQENVQ